jgi:hypothetical protein
MHPAPAEAEKSTKSAVERPNKASHPFFYKYYLTNMGEVSIL